MIERTTTIGSAKGLHARPAKLFTQAVVASGAQVTLAKGDGKPVNAASILALIALGINHGDEVTVSVHGESENEVLEQILELLRTDHDEQ